MTVNVERLGLIRSFPGIYTGVNPSGSSARSMMEMLLKLTARGRKIMTSLEEAPGLPFSLSWGYFSTRFPECPP